MATLNSSSEEEDIKSGMLLQKEKLLLKYQWIEKWVVLRMRQIQVFKNQKDQKKGASPKRYLLEKGSVIKEPHQIESSICSDAPVSDCCFEIIGSDGKELILCAPSKQDLSDWLAVVKQAAEGRKDMSKETVAIEEELRKSGQHIRPEDLDFDDKEILGSGASGVVKKGMWLKSTVVAVKALKNLPEFTDNAELISFYQEIATLSKLRHSNIVQMYGFCRKDNYLCLITEYVKGGNLSQCLAAKDRYNLELHLKFELAKSITRGMVYLHSQNVIHRDLKPANILIESWDEGKVKVCDFGISKVVVKKNAETSQPDDTMGSPQYAAPELNTAHDNKVDVFSFAIVLWEIAHRELPWPEIKFGWQFGERYAKKERPSITDTVFKLLIEACWDHNPADRYSFQQIYEELQQLQKKNDKQETNPSPSTIRSPSLTLSGQNGISSLPSPSNTIYGRLEVPPKSVVGGVKMMLPNPPKVSTPVSGTDYFPNGTAKTSSPTTGPPIVRTTSVTATGLTSVGKTTSSQNLSTSGTVNNNGPAPVPYSKQNTSEQLVSKSFGNKATVTWENFAKVLGDALTLSFANVAKLRFIFEKHGMVEKSTWDQFLNWFTPLAVTESFYQTGPVENPDGFTGDLIISICTHPWFHGFLSSSDASAILKGKPDGTFLMRFSTGNPRQYALSVSHKGLVGHWRIQCDKSPKQEIVFKIDSRDYKSLVDIVDTHQAGKEPLIIKTASKDFHGDPQCYLSAPYPRPEQENLYQNLYQNFANS